MIFANLLNGQLQDTIQRKVLKKWGIKKIEKFLLSDSNSINDGFLLTEEVVNDLGYITKMLSYADDGSISIYEHLYFNDSLLLESHMKQNSKHFAQEDRIVYVYSKKNLLEGFCIYLNERLASRIKNSYSKNGLLKSQNQKMYANKSTGSYGGKVNHFFEYNSKGEVTAVKIESKKNGKRSRESYKYVYQTDPKVVEQWLSNNGNEQIKERIVFDENNKVKMTEHYYYHKSTTLQYSTKKLKLNKGEALRKEYFYDERGLISIEVLSVLPGQEIKIKYRYSD